MDSDDGIVEYETDSGSKCRATMSATGFGRGRPAASPSIPSSGSQRAMRFLPVLVLILTVVVAHFLRLPEFGLYEDDYYFVGEPMGWTLPEAVDATADAFTGWPLGRPVGLAIPRLLAFAAGAHFGLTAVYLLCVAVLAGNAVLAFRLASRFCPVLPAFVVGLGFCLFPADTTRIFPTYALQMNLSQTFALSAASCILAGRRSLALLFFSLVLLTYETPSLPLFLVPLLAGVAWQWAWRQWFATWSPFTLALLMVAGIRSSMGEGRILETLGGDRLLLISKVAAAPFVGIFTSVKLMARRPIDALSMLSALEWLVVISCFFALLLVLARLDTNLHADGSDRAADSRATPSHHRPSPLPEEADRSTWTLFVGCMTWLAGYGLSFTHWPPTAEAGRATSVHGGATLGAAITLGALVWCLERWMRDRRARVAFGPCLALYFSLLVGFHLTVQHDFADSWAKQRGLWTRIVQLCPDLEEGTVIFLRPEGLPTSAMALVNSWADPLVLELIFRFPESWSSVPRVFTLHDFVERSFTEEAGTVRWRIPDATWRSHVAELDLGNVVVLTSAGGDLQRAQGRLRINAIEVVSKRKTASTVESLPRGPVFRLLLGDALP